MYSEWDEIEKILKTYFAARRQEQTKKELAQIKEALPIGRVNKNKVDSKSESASVEKSESNTIPSESIRTKAASFVKKGHDKHRKTVVLDFYKFNGTYFLPYEFRDVEIDEPQG